MLSSPHTRPDIIVRKECAKTLWRDLCYDDRLNRTKFAIAVQNDHYVIVAGGYGQMSTSVIMLDVLNCVAISLPNLPSDDYHGSCIGTVLDEYFYLTSRYGECPAYRINLKTRVKWEKVDGRQRHYGETAVANNSNLFLFSDHGNEAYIPRTNTWVSLPFMTKPRWAHASAVCRNKVYIMGGYDDSKFEPTDSVEVYDIIKRTWNSSPPLPRKLYGAAATLVADRFIIVTGGETDDEATTTDCFVFDIETQKWFNSPVSLSTPRSNHGCVAVNNHSKLIIVGGVVADGNSKQSMPYNESIKISQVVNFHIAKHIIAIRHLIEQGRALAKGGIVCKEQLVIQKFITQMDTDMFRHMLSFLMVSNP